MKSFAHGVTTGFSASRFCFFQEQEQQQDLPLKDQWQWQTQPVVLFVLMIFFFGVEMRAKCKNLRRTKNPNQKCKAIGVCEKICKNNALDINTRRHTHKLTRTQLPGHK